MQPLLRWGTLAPIVNAAATAYPRETPLAIAHLATELAETALNLGPSQYSGSNRLIACNHQQGLLILATALRLVAEADVCPRATETTVNEERLYSRWFRSCFGVALPSGDGTAAHGAGEIQARLTSSGQGSENAVPEDQESIQSVGGFSDVSRGFSRFSWHHSARCRRDHLNERMLSTVSVLRSGRMQIVGVRCVGTWSVTVSNITYSTIIPPRAICRFYRRRWGSIAQRQSLWKHCAYLCRLTQSSYSRSTGMC